MALLTLNRRQQGFSLVELMVAATIGLIILAAVAGLFTTTKTTYNTQDNLARLQENARFAVYYLTDDIRKAGYSGCLENIANVKNNLNTPAPFNFNVTIAMEGLDNTNPGQWHPSATLLTPAGIVPGTDAITLRLAETTGITITTYMPETSAILQVSSIAGLTNNSVIMVSNCEKGDIIQITNLDAAALTVQHAPGGAVAGDPTAPGNLTPHVLSSGYGPGPPPATVMRFTTRTYYIMNRANADGTVTPVLVRQDNGGGVQELIEGVENMQIIYGIDTDPISDGTPNVFVRANQVAGQIIVANGLTINPWTRVRSVRIALVLRTLGNNEQYVDNTPITITGFRDAGGVDEIHPAAGDRNQRRLFTFSVNPRNI